MRFTTKANLVWLPSEVMICKCMQLLPPSAITIDDLPLAALASVTEEPAPVPDGAKKKANVYEEDEASQLESGQTKKPRNTRAKARPPASPAAASPRPSSASSSKDVLKAKVVKVKMETQSGLKHFFGPKSSSAAPVTEAGFTPP